MKRPQKLLKFFEMFESGAPHHIAAVGMLEEALPPELLDRNSDWIVCFNAATSEEYNK